MKAVRRLLANWYGRNARKLPWRETRNPYRILVSEIMLQQTRVAAVLPYYERFLARFPDVAALAGASEDDVLAAWSGLGYYRRARYLRKAAQHMAAQGRFPGDYESIRNLPGVGEYTAAAIASIAFGLPYAVLDGNVLRVLSRLAGDRGDIGSAPARARLRKLAEELLDRQYPGRSNQALMELGATVCLPRAPQCGLCPLRAHCEARRLGQQDELPVKLRRSRTVRIEKTLFVIEQGVRLLLWKRPGGAQMEGFWELPESNLIPHAKPLNRAGQFRHAIMNHAYVFTVLTATLRGTPDGFAWIPRGRLSAIPLSTTARKALACLKKSVASRSPRGTPEA